MKRGIYIVVLCIGAFLVIGVGSDTDLGDVERAIKDIILKGYGYSPELLNEQLQNMSLTREETRYKKYQPISKNFINAKKAQKILIEKFSHIKKKAWEDYLAHRLPWQNTHQPEGNSTGPLTPPQPQQPPPQPLPQPTSPPSPTDIQKMEEECIAEHNNYRKSIGLNELSADQKLIIAARKHSEHMAKVGTPDHEGIGDGTPWSRCQAEGTTCAAENVAMGRNTAKQTFQAWLNSPPHKANIENRGWRRMGCGFASPHWWTAVFAP